MKNNLLPNIDLNNSRDYYGAYNTQDLYKGKSFSMSGEWKDGSHYFNDESLTDFISFNDTLLSCNKTHIASSHNMPILLTKIVDGVEVPCGVKNTTYWNFVLAGIPGKGKIYIPSYDETTGLLSWNVSYEEEIINPVNIKGVGITNISDETSEDGLKQKLTITYGDGETEVVELPHGKDGSTIKEIKQLDGATFRFVFADNNTEQHLDLNLSPILEDYYKKNDSEGSLEDVVESIVNEKIQDVSFIDGGETEFLDGTNSI